MSQLRIDSSAEGFSLSVGERRILSHSRRNPCLEATVLEGVSGRPPRRRALPLRSFALTRSDGDSAEIRFEGKMSMGLRLSDGKLRISFEGPRAAIASFALRLAPCPEEAVYGCGERYGKLDLKGSRIDLRIEDEAPPGRGELAARLGRLARRAAGEGAPSRFPVPAFVSTAGYWCCVDTACPIVADFRRPATALESASLPREVVLGFDSDPEALVSSLSAYLGRQATPPEWAFDGAILGVEGGSAEMRKKLEASIEAGVPVAAVWVRDWCGRRRPGARGGGAWAWDRGLYPDLPREIAALRAQGIRFMGYVSDLLSIEGPAYAEASERGLCVKAPGGADLILDPQSAPCALLDLSSPEASAWMEDLITREMTGIGMAGWVAESGESLPPEAILASSADSAAARLAWPELWARINRAAILAAPRPEELLFFVRSGWLGSARGRGAVWAGERASDFSADGLPSLVPAALSLGFSGVGFWHTEIGGSRSPRGAGRSLDCLGRWMETAAFSPFFRTGEGGSPALDAQPWSNPAAMALFSRMAGIFAALKPYHSATAEDYSLGGLPPIRHPWIHYPDDPAVPALDRQYMYGRDLMVAPALAPAAEFTSLHLPRDEWVHLWSSRRFAGGSVTVDAPPGCPAVFYRASSPFAPLFDAVRRTARRLR